MHDVVGCYIDMDKGQLSFSKNGKRFLIIHFFVLVFLDLFLLYCGCISHKAVEALKLLFRFTSLSEDK